MAENKSLFEILTSEQIIAVLSKEEDKLSGELTELRKFHQAAWLEYGSELCSGEMLGKESAIAKKILGIQKMKEIVSSRKLNGKMLKEILIDIDRLIARADELQASLNKDKEALNEEKSLFTRMMEVVSK